MLVLPKILSMAPCGPRIKPRLLSKFCHGPPSAISLTSFSQPCFLPLLPHVSSVLASPRTHHPCPHPPADAQAAPACNALPSQLKGTPPRLNLSRISPGEPRHLVHVLSSSDSLCTTLRWDHLLSCLFPQANCELQPDRQHVQSVSIPSTALDVTHSRSSDTVSGWGRKKVLTSELAWGITVGMIFSSLEQGLRRLRVFW